MKRDLYEYMKANPLTWFTVEDIANHFKVKLDKARTAVSQMHTRYHMLEQKTENGRLFFRFDKVRYDAMV